MEHGLGECGQLCGRAYRDDVAGVKPQRITRRWSGPCRRVSFLEIESRRGAGPAAQRHSVMRYSASGECSRYTRLMPGENVRTVYVQQQQVPGGWEDHAETEDRAIANARYKSFAREKGTR